MSGSGLDVEGMEGMSQESNAIYAGEQLSGGRATSCVVPARRGVLSPTAMPPNTRTSGDRESVVFFFFVCFDDSCVCVLRVFVSDGKRCTHAHICHDDCPDVLSGRSGSN